MPGKPPGWRVPVPFQCDTGQKSLWPLQVLGPFIEDVNALKPENRTKATAVLQRLVEGQKKAWGVDAGQPERGGELWERAVEATQLGTTALMLWWVELDATTGQQYLVVFRIVRSVDVAEARHFASQFLRTFSDSYLQASLLRKTNGQTVAPAEVDMAAAHPLTRDAYEESAQGERPVSLEKRYRMTERHMQRLIKYGLNRVQLPFVLDEDEQSALDKVLFEPLFLLGRSGSGKTSVQVHALYYIHKAEYDCGVARPSEDPEAPGPILLVTRSPLLALSIRRLFEQMCAALKEGSAPGLAVDEDLGLVGNDDPYSLEELPNSFQKKDIKAGTSPFIASWASFVAAADASFPGAPFFRSGHRGQSTVQRAKSRMQRAQARSSGNAEEDGAYDLEDELSFEFFAAEFGPKLFKGPLNKGDSLFVVFKEILTVILGSLHAVRSRAGFLSVEEYVGGCDAGGFALAELKDSGVRDQEMRSRVYRAFEMYRKLKYAAGKYDRVDPVRHIVKRAKKFRRPQRYEAFRMLSAVFIDEVQDLLPAEILLLRLFCPHNNSWIFAGDTAQTISKGVEFRFASLRRLFCEEFLADRDWVDEVAPVREQVKCTMCEASISKPGGLLLECNSHWSAHNARVCGDACYNSFAKKCDNALKGASEGVRNKHEWAQAHGKLSCPMPRCALYMKESKIEVEEEIKEFEDEADTSRPVSLSDMPDIHHLRHNHRSSRAILDLASSIVDALVVLFPDKIDKLPREVSQVDDRLRPVFITGMTFTEALDIVFNVANAPADQVPEFGAKQAVLVWSESAQERVKQRFPMSMVMTIHDSKGLEFHDVLLVNPFSDMASSLALQAHTADLWSLIYHCGPCGAPPVPVLEPARTAPAFDPSAHGLLCSWLKALYVAVTRARQRVWIVEEQAALGAPMLSYWMGAGVVRLVSSARDAAACPELAQGFAKASTMEEYMDQGYQMLQNSRFDEAVVLFKRAHTSGHPTAGLWRDYALALRMKHQASLCDHARAMQRHKEAGGAFVALARDLERLPDGRRPDGLAVRSIRLLAAENYARALEFSLAAPEYGSAGVWNEAAKSWQEAGRWKEAGDAWASAGEVQKSLSAYIRGDAWDCFVDCVERMGHSPTVDAKWLHDTLRQACRRLKQLVLGQARSGAAWGFLRRCLLLVPAELRDAVIQSIALPGMDLEVLDLQGRFEDCAALCLSRLDWKGAFEYYERAGKAELALRVRELVRLRGLTWAGPLTHLQKAAERCANNFPSRDNCLGACMQHLYTWSQHVSSQHDFEAVSSLWARCSEDDARDLAVQGHALRFKVIAFTIAARELDLSEERWELLRRWFASLTGDIEEHSRALVQSLSSDTAAAPLPARSEQFIFQLLLVEHLPFLRPGYVVLGDVLPPAAHSRALSLERVWKLAQAVLSLLLFHLHIELFGTCERWISRLCPCWSHLAHGRCLVDGCKASHGADALPEGAARSAVRLACRSWDDARRLVQKRAVACAYEALGPKAVELVGERLGLLSAEEKLRTCGQALLMKVLFPPLPATAPVPLGTAVRSDATASLVRYATDRFLAELHAKRGVLTLEDLLASPGVLLFGPWVDYHGLPALNDLVKRRGATKSAKNLLGACAVAQAASPQGRKDGVKEPDYSDLLNFFRMSAQVADDLCWQCCGDTRTREAPPRHGPPPKKDDHKCPVAPHILCHLLERVVVWGNVLLTRFCNTTLPTSYARMHLAPHSTLAALAADNALPWEERATVFNALEKVVIGNVGRLLKSDKFLPWVRKHCAAEQETVLRLLTALFACGSINWLRWLRNDNTGIRETVAGIRLDRRLNLMNENGGHLGPSSLPKQLQWLMAGVPRDKSVTVAPGTTRDFDRMTPWFHSVLVNLGDPLVMMHRDDSTKKDTPPGWTQATHPLSFQHDEFFPAQNLDRRLRILRDRLGTDWPPQQVELWWPPVRRTVVCKRQGDVVECNFEDLGQGESAESAEQDGAEGGFTLDKDATRESGASSAADFKCETDEQAAAALAFTQKPLPLRTVVALKMRLRSVRRRLNRNLDPRSALRRSEEAWLLGTRSSPLKCACYLGHVLPVLQRHDEEHKRLHEDLRQELERKELVPGGPADIALDALEQLTFLFNGFHQEHARAPAASIADTYTACLNYWQARKGIWEGLLLPSLRSLGLEHCLVSSGSVGGLRSWAERARSRLSKRRRVWRGGKKRRS